MIRQTISRKLPTGYKLATLATAIFVAFVAPLEATNIPPESALTITGGHVVVNDDDTNKNEDGTIGNDIWDKSEVGSDDAPMENKGLEGPKTDTKPEPVLKEFKFTAKWADCPGTLVINIPNSSNPLKPPANIKLWKDAKKLEPFDLAESYGVTEGPAKTVTFWVEGITHTESFDSIKFTAVYTVTNPTTGQSATATGTIAFGVTQADLDIDSDNKNGTDASGYDEAEDQIEFSFKEQHPGKIILETRNDVDSDGVIDSVDGISELLGTGGTPTVAGLKLIPMRLILDKPFDPATAKVKFSYRASVPRLGEGIAANGQDAAGNTIYRITTPGMRLWIKDGDARTSGKDVGTTGGDFIPANTEIKWQDLFKPEGSESTEKIIYVEYVDVEGSDKQFSKEDIVVEITDDTSAGKGYIMYDLDEEKKQPLSGNISPDGVNAALLPVEVRDLNVVAEATDDKVLQNISNKKNGESDNDYYQRDILDAQIAFIDPHRGENETPEMPNLAARISNGPEGVKVKWRIEVEYLRGNGYRTSYSKAAYNKKELVQVPAVGKDGKATFTAEMGADKEWKMFEHADWIKEITDKGFFGGTAKVYMWLATEKVEPTKPIITFRIGGKNPEEAKVKAFIATVVKEKDNRLWFSYAVAKSETYGRVKENGNIRYYNQFYTGYKGGPIGDKSRDMGWAAWAKSWPLYNFDRYYSSKAKSRVQNGPGGYGIYQITGTIADSEAVIARKILWNWQENVRAGIDLIKSKASWVDGRHPKLTETYPKAGDLPSYPIEYSGNKKKFSSWDAYTITAYNGLAGGGIKRKKLKGYKGLQRTCWIPDEKNMKWTFGENMNEYVKKIFNRVEE